MAKVKITITVEESDATIIARTLEYAARQREQLAAEGDPIWYPNLMAEANMLRGQAIIIKSTKPGAQ